VSFADVPEQVHVHLGLYGTFVVTPAVGLPVVGQVRWRIEAEATADLRGPNACELLMPPEVDARIARLGPDPLRPDADPERAWRRIHRSNTPIAALLMDQAVVAGVGNVYRAEVLFRNEVAPMTAGRRVTRKRWDAMWADLVDLMRDGVRTGRIDTVRREHEPEVMGRAPRDDDHGGEVYVYRRDQQDCLVCGTPVRRRVLAGRNLFWCPTCQHRG
jgi:formamidopyrimidine-DNA glycosylase